MENKRNKEELTFDEVLSEINDLVYRAWEVGFKEGKAREGEILSEVYALGYNNGVGHSSDDEDGDEDDNKLKIFRDEFTNLKNSFEEISEGILKIRKHLEYGKPVGMEEIKKTSVLEEYLRIQSVSLIVITDKKMHKHTAEENVINLRNRYKEINSKNYWNKDSYETLNSSMRLVDLIIMNLNRVLDENQSKNRFSVTVEELENIYEYSVAAYTHIHTAKNSMLNMHKYLNELPNLKIKKSYW
jgi:hypothetical protein